MRFLLVFLAIFLYGNINQKITTTKKTLIQTKAKISNMNSELDSIVKKINNAQQYLNNITKRIQTLNQQIITLQNSLKNKNKYLQELNLKKAQLLAKKRKLENEVIDFVSNNYYIQNKNIASEQDLINEEILKVVAQQSAKKMENISIIYNDINQQIVNITKIILDIKNAKTKLEQRKLELAKLQKKQKQYIIALNNIKAKYKARLQKIIAEQRKLQQRLSKLNIIKYKQTRTTNQNLAKIDQVRIKKYGNVYMKSRTIRYRGKKTIPPLRGKIVKRFGSYIDPIYHIKLYNESITIKTKPNTKVRAIFDGTVVFVGNTNDGKMIVIKHKNQLHSIYAKLSRISPFIKKGYRVKRGEVIAKVNNELEFETTYKTSPINPLEVIKF